MRNTSGLRRGGGRPRGVPNKLTSSFKAAVMAAFDDIGGDRAFAKWAKKNPTEFYKIAARMIPTEVVGDPDKPLAVKVSFGGRYRPETPQS